jgi:aspartyl-tRNA(Asn)/glutamyl-tRNA(Gln) amidotransferase subunit A
MSLLSRSNLQTLREYCCPPDRRETLRMTDGIANMSLVAVSSAIREGRLSAREVTALCLERAERAQPHLNCFVTLDPDRALEAAAAADTASSRARVVGSLHGIPLAHKDIFYRRGRVSTCGSAIRRTYVPDYTATVLKRLDAAGAIDIGTLNMSEFALGPTGHNVHLGDCCNPWNRDHVPGGSSSGPAAATAARIVYGALGSDTAGSIRLPAACCGLVGLKPTQSRTSRHGVMPLSFSLDTVGPLTRTVQDCARLTGIVAGSDPNDPACSNEAVPNYEADLMGGVKGMRMGIPKNYFYDDLTEEVRTCLEESLRVYQSLGAELVSIELPDLTRVNDLANILLSAEAASIHARWMHTQSGEYSAEIRSRLRVGYYLPATAYLEASRCRGPLLAQFIQGEFGKIDVMHVPVLGIPVPKLDETRFVDSAGLPELLTTITRYTRPINYLGLPALSVPCGFSPNGLPVGFQLVGRPFSESLLFRAGHAYQEVTPWHTVAPQIF